MVHFILSHMWVLEYSTPEMALGHICATVFRGISHLWPVLPIVGSGHGQAGPVVPKFQVISTSCPVCSDRVKWPHSGVLARDLDFLLRSPRDKDRVPACPTEGSMGRLGAGA